MGPTGPGGADGKNGADGLNGINGKDGLNGQDGAQGIQGIQGEAGKDGIDGEPGPQGLNGEPGEDAAHPSEFWDSWKDLTDDFDDYPADRFEGSGEVNYKLIFITVKSVEDEKSYIFYRYRCFAENFYRDA